MIDPVTLTAYAGLIGVMTPLIDKLLNEFKVWQKQTLQDQRSERMSEAVHKLQKALHSTKVYLADPQKINDGEIIRLWDEAKLATEEFSPALSALCNIKREIYLNPEAWPSADIKEANATLDKVTKRIDEFIKSITVAAPL